MCLFTSHNKRICGSFAVLTSPKCHCQAFISMRYYLLMIEAVALRISAGRYTPCLYEMVIKMRKIEDSLLVQIYAQKFLTYIVCLISSYVIFLEIFFNLDKLVKLDLIIRVIFTILILIKKLLLVLMIYSTLENFLKVKL